MNNSVTMGFVESVGDFDPALQSLVERQCTLLQSVGEGVPFDVLHDHEVDAVLAADVVKSADVGVIQAGDGTGFSLESLPDFGMAGYVRRKDFDGDGAIEPGVFGLVDFTHATCTERCEDFVGTQFGAGIE